MNSVGLYLAAGLAIALAGQGRAYNGDHGAFDEKAAPKPIPIEEMSRPDGDGAGKEPNVLRHVLANDAGIQLLVQVEDTGAFLELLAGTRQLLPRQRFSDSTFAPGVQAFASEFNGDGQRDFVVYAYSGGCGLACGSCDVAFLLSGKDGYRLTTVSTLFPNPGSYVVLGGKPCFIHTAFSGVDKCKDGKSHNFWIYNILTIEGDSLRIDNRLSPGFPRTIWYSFKPNHKETTLISEAQKGELIREAQREMMRKH